MESKSIRVADDAFWADLGPTLQNGVARQMQRQETGAVLAAPAFVDTDVRGTLPAVGWYVATLRDARKLQLQEQALLVAVSLETGRVFTGLAFEPRPVETPPAGDLGDPGEGLTGVTFELDVFERLGLPRRPGNYLVSLIVRNQMSNRVRVRVGPSPTRYEDPEVARFMEQRLQAEGPPKVWPPAGRSLPSYERRPDSLPVPDEVGIVLAVPRVLLVEPGVSCPLQGSFRLRALPQELMPPQPPEAAGDKAASHPSAVVGITLVLVGADVAGPFVARLAVPADAVQPGEPRPEVTGQFAVDLLSLPQMDRDARTHFAYAFAGEIVSEPAVLALVTPDMLPV